jgi:hypothetical protein
VQLSLKTQNEGNTPLNFEVVANSPFEVIDDELKTHDDVKNIVVANACSILLGIIRQKVIEITMSMSAQPPIIVPMIQPKSFISSDEEGEEEDPRK